MAITQKKEHNRLEEWRNWVEVFQKISATNPIGEYTTIANAAELLNDYYWRLANDYLRPMLKGHEHNLHYYKIISASELTVMAVMPFVFIDENKREERKKLNAEFAFQVALSILLNWKVGGKEVTDSAHIVRIIDHREIIDNDNGKEKKYALNFMDEHIDWLKYLNTAGPLPVLSNGQTWRMVVIAAKALNNEIP